MFAALKSTYFSRRRICWPISTNEVDNMDCNFNRVRLCGRISSDPALSHVNHGETFYRFVLSVQRLSGQCDDLPVIVPRQLLRACPLGRGDAAAVTGQLRSFNNRSGQGRRLIISVFAQTLERGSGVPCNRIQLGARCASPRTTAVHRSGARSAT